MISGWLLTPECRLGLRISRIALEGRRDRGHELLVLLREAGFLNATDPKDKVYGMLGLAYRAQHDQRNVPVVLAVYYTKPLREVYAIATAGACLQRGDLVTLRHKNARLMESQSSEDDIFPSWVPRWDRRPDYEAGDTKFMNWVYKADTLRPMKCEYGTGCVLRLDGIVAESITAVHDEVLAHAADDYANFFALGNSFAEAHLTSPSKMHDVLATMSCRRQPGHEAAHEAVLQPGSRIREELLTFLGVQEMYATESDEGGRSMSVGCWAVVQDFWNTCRNRRLFVTSSGHLGIGPQTSREGDIIAILFGEQAPHSPASSASTLFQRLPFVRMVLSAACYSSLTRLNHDMICHLGRIPDKKLY
ncbi:Uu.00g015570.m01.CDS01 [Anthostomella pinea]|uniref:Uu.00g015570.m01.CDS01 n=1 Tax=Anthostomella pinea TaxID=933095 RepID=A0AAI8VZS1_9PEZI|nr:Uu.00g015570.m01.CDS01 [Anthostomella pinea]